MRPRLLAALLAGAALAPAPVLARPFMLAPEATADAQTPAARCARAFVELINNPTPERVLAFENQWASSARLRAATAKDRVPRVAALASEWGTLKLADVFPAGSAAIAQVSASRGPSLEMTFNMSATEPGRLDAIEIAPSGGPSRLLDEQSRRESVQGVATVLREGYVFPEKGAAMADAILARLGSGEYDAITNEAVLARQLTEDCRAITRDLHLGIRAEAEREPQTTHAPESDQMRRENYAFRKVELLPGNIGYLKFDAFIEDDQAKRVASSAMSFLSGADAIIFDLRTNGGGSPDMIRYLTSYLFDSRTHLNDMVDREGKVVEEYWTLDAAPGPGPRTDIPVYVLTSARTFSGAEEFSYNLKNLKRATIVGETTGGGAHPVRAERVGGRFTVRVPFMRAQNPITRTNWEGAGVEPDVKTPAGEALDKALELAREAVEHK